MMGEKIEFYGEQLSILAIAKRIGISRETLNKHYMSTGNIYEAEKICKKIIEDKQASLIDYNGEKLAIQTIAKRVGIKDAKTLKKYYKQTGDIYKAIEKCNESKIEYHGEQLTLDAIAKKEGLKRDTLERYYNNIENIYEEVEVCLENKRKAENAKVTYKGEKRTITSIARELGINKSTLRKYYEKVGDIEQAIELHNRNQQETEDSKIEYKGEHKFLKAIAREEDIAETTLTRYFQKYGNIDKAVFMAKIQRQKSRQVKIKDGDVNLYDLSIILGIKYSKLINSLNSGMSIEEIKEQNQNSDKRRKLKQEYTILSNGQTLLEYCVENGLNYAFIYRSINTYGKTIEEAVQQYKENGSNMPSNWIFGKYGLLLRHLMTSNSIDIQRVVDYMRKEQISMSEAIEKYIIRRNSKDGKLDADWMQEVYGVLTDGNMSDEYEEFKKTFYIDETEEECIIKSQREIQTLERKLLLFEIAEAIRENVFSAEEVPELLQIYEVQPDEIETIFLDLYSKFQNGKMLGEEQPQMKRKSLLNEITRKWYYLGQKERENILTDNEVTDEEKKIIIDLSNKIVKHKNMLKVEEKDKMVGGN